MFLRMVVVAVVLALAGVGRAAPADPVADPRLGEVRARLVAIIAAASSQGLPERLLVDKVREGLAKAVPPGRIVAAVAALRTDLASAQGRARGLGIKAPPPGLLRAMAEAGQAGLPHPQVDALLRTSAGRRAGPAALETSTRALDALTDLRLAGFPLPGALRVVAALAAREPVALARVGADLGRLRRAEGLTPAEAVDAVGLGLERGEHLERALRNAPGEAAASRGGERGRGAGAGRKAR